MVKFLTHGLRGFNGAVQRRLTTLTVTMLISSCWQMFSEVELRRIFNVCRRWANSGSHEFVKKNMVWYMRPHGRFAHCSCKNAALTLDLGLSVSAAGSCCIFTLAVRQPPVLASCIEIYYYWRVRVFSTNRRWVHSGSRRRVLKTHDSIKSLSPVVHTLFFITHVWFQTFFGVFKSSGILEWENRQYF